MRVCILGQILDAYKGGNHLPLLAACKNTEFTILTNRTKPRDPDLPSNVKVLTLGKRIGSFYYGFADWLYAYHLLKAYPPSDPFWQQFDVIHLNQTMGTRMLKLIKTGVPVPGMTISTMICSSKIIPSIAALSYAIFPTSAVAYDCKHAMPRSAYS